jgi:hypothetical protein
MLLLSLVGGLLLVLTGCMGDDKDDARSSSTSHSSRTARSAVAIPATALPPSVQAAFAHRRFATKPRKAIETAGFTLWVSGARGGGWCEGLQHAPIRFRALQVSCRWPVQGNLIAATWSPQLFWGRVTPKNAEKLELEFADGRSMSVPMNDGFFLYHVPDAALAQGATKALVAYDAKDDEVGRLDLSSPIPPLMTFAGIRRPPGGARVALRRRAMQRPSEWGRAAIWTAPSGVAPARCWWLTLGSRVYGGGCRRKTPEPRSLWEVAPLRFTDRGQTVEILYGQVGDDVASLRLRFQDGREEPLAIENGFYLYPVPPSHAATGHRPAFLIASAADGRTLKKRLLVQYTATVNDTATAGN